MDDKLWVYHTPEFESDGINLEMMKYSPWSGHRRFVYDLVANTRPECIVELGSYYGCSAFTFLQALKDFDMKSFFYAIDTWEGDSFTENDYKENIYESYKSIQEQCFSNQNAIMKRMTFDQACCDFEDESIDLLHIDGSHTYEDCRHDFETWVSKVSKEGIIMFHDISDDKLDGEVLGSHLFWLEVKEHFPFTLEFPYSFGLGVLYFDEKKYCQVRNSINFEYYQKLENHAAVEHKDVIRKQYFKLRDNQSYIAFLNEQLSTARSYLHEYEKTQKQKDDYIQQLEKANEHLLATCRDVEKEVNRINCDYQENLEAYRIDNGAKDKYISELQATILEYKDTVSAKDSYIAELQATIQKYSDTVSAKDSYISELEATIGDFNSNTLAKDEYIHSLSQEIFKRDQTSHQLMEDVDRLNREKEEAIGDYQKTIDGKERYITELLETIKKYEETEQGKNSYIQELLANVTLLKAREEEQSREIKLLEMQNQEQKVTLEEISLQNHDSQLQVVALQDELKKQYLSRRENQDAVMRLQQEMATTEKQLADLRENIKRMPLGDRILNRMEKR